VFAIYYGIRLASEIHVHSYAYSALCSVGITCVILLRGFQIRVVLINKHKESVTIRHQNFNKCVSYLGT
jgi:hypothetical protein